MSGIELLIGAIYVGSTIKTTISTIQWAHSWVKWARGPVTPPHVERAWQWIDKDDYVVVPDEDRPSLITIERN